MYGHDGEQLYVRLEQLRTHARTAAKLKAQIDFFLIERLHGRAQQHVEVEGGTRLVEPLAAARASDGGTRRWRSEPFRARTSKGTSTADIVITSRVAERTARFVARHRDAPTGPS